MDSKLTLSLDKVIIEKAKTYAKSNKTSLSRLIESYLATLIKKNTNDLDITPLVESLSGVILLNSNSNNDAEYTDFLMQKYK